MSKKSANLKIALRLLTCTVALYAAASSAQAASVLLQAESYTSTTTTRNAGVGPGFTSILDVNASGGAYATTLGDNLDAAPSDYASYQVTFSVAGLYTLYIRALAEGTSNTEQIPNDSFFTPTALGASPTFGNRMNSIELTTPDPVPLYHWINAFTRQGLEYNGEVNTTNSNQYNVLAAGVQTFVIGGRENGLRLDAFVFSDNASLTAAELNTIAGIPEPSSALLGALGLLGLATRRHRKA